MDCSLPGSSVHGISQARVLKWGAIAFSKPRAAAAAAKSLQSCPTLCDPIDGSPPGTPFPGILQARTLEWVAISFSNICICIYLKLSQFAEYQKLRQNCELTVLQFKTKKGKKRRSKMVGRRSSRSEARH